MKKTFIISLLSFFICIQSIYPQITTNELPVSIQKGTGVLTKDKAKGLVNLPIPNIKKILDEDSVIKSNKQNSFKRTSISIPLKLNPNENGVWTELEDGGKLWQMEIRAQKALALDFVFSKFWLPQGGKFFLYNPSTNESIGAITSNYLIGEKSKPNRFSTGIIKGDNIIIEYYQPAGEKELPIIEVEKAYYTYVPIPAFKSSCDCEVNVNCSEGLNWQLHKNAVSIVYCKFDQGGGWCCGSLVNNTSLNLAPLYLTADHCLGLDLSNIGGYLEKKDAISDYNLSDWVFYWEYELANCSDTIQPNYNKTTVGAIVKANNPYSDFALLQLQQDPLNIPGYIPYYLGWDASGNSGTGGVCIHHPKHDVKKISTYDCTPGTVSFNNSPSVYWAVSWIPTINGYGITEEGSSGAPLINNDHKVIGQLRGESVIMDCLNQTGTSKFGKLSVSWTGNGNSDYRRRLNYWLDPNGTNSQCLNGLFPYKVSGPSLICGLASGTYSINNLPSYYAITWVIDNNDFSITTSGNQCVVSYTGAEEFGIANLTANIYYNSLLLRQITKEVVVGTPPLDVILEITGGDGSPLHWTSNMTGNIVDFQDSDIPIYYSQFEANLYKMSALDPYDTLIRHWDSFASHVVVNNITSPGWYLLQVRGINSCGVSEWVETEIECIDTNMLRANGEDTELALMYNRQGQILTVTINRLSQSRPITDGIYTIQLWNETSMVREFKQKDPIIKIPMAGLKNGLYTIRYLDKDKVIAKKFIKQ